MKREIKFRAWYPDMKLMIQDVPVYKNCHYHLSDDIDIKLEFSKCELMQFIGLTDINGVAIYEKDVIEFYPSDEVKMIMFIDFKEGSFALCADETSHIYNIPINSSWLEVTKSKVIGNMYENPEAVKKQSVTNNNENSKAVRK